MSTWNDAVVSCRLLTVEGGDRCQRQGWCHQACDFVLHSSRAEEASATGAGHAWCDHIDCVASDKACGSVLDCHSFMLCASTFIRYPSKYKSPPCRKISRDGCRGSRLWRYTPNWVHHPDFPPYAILLGVCGASFSPSRSLYVVVNPSVCRLSSVCL